MRLSLYRQLFILLQWKGAAHTAMALEGCAGLACRQSDHEDLVDEAQSTSLFLTAYLTSSALFFMSSLLNTRTR